MDWEKVIPKAILFRRKHYAWEDDVLFIDMKERKKKEIEVASKAFRDKVEADLKRLKEKQGGL